MVTCKYATLHTEQSRQQKPENRSSKQFQTNRVLWLFLRCWHMLMCFCCWWLLIFYMFSEVVVLGADFFISSLQMNSGCKSLWNHTETSRLNTLRCQKLRLLLRAAWCVCGSKNKSVATKYPKYEQQKKCLQNSGFLIRSLCVKHFWIT